MTIEIEDPDRRILRVLQSNGRMANQDLADAANLSASACWRRVRALESIGIVSKYVAIVDAGKTGLTFRAIVHVTLNKHDVGNVDKFIKGVARRREVLQCFATTGEADYHLLVVCEDKDRYNRFLEEFLFQLPCIAHVRTNLVLREIKDTTELPL